MVTSMAELPNLFGDDVEVQSVPNLPTEIPSEPAVNSFEDLEGTAREAAEALAGPTDDLFGDADDDVDNASVATEQLGETLTEQELAARRALEYNEEDIDYSQIQTTEERTATVTVRKLPAPSSTDGNHWHIKLPSFLRYDEQEFDERSWEEPLDETEDFPEENIIRWRRAAGGPRSRDSNARIVRWSDGSQSLQVGDEFFDVTTTLSQAKDEEGGRQAAGAGLTLLVGQHPQAALLETQAIITGQMTFTPYHISSVAHRRLANTMADKHAKLNRTMQLDVDKDPELERIAREKLESDKAKAARRERAKAAGPRRRRRGLRSYAIDHSDEGEEPMDESGEEGLGADRPRRTRASYLDGPDDEDERFIVESDQEGAADAVGEDEGEDDLDRMEASAERTNRDRRKGIGRPPDQRTDNRMDVDRPPPQEEAAYVRRKLVVGGSDDED